MTNNGERPKVVSLKELIWITSIVALCVTAAIAWERHRGHLDRHVAEAERRLDLLERRMNQYHPWNFTEGRESK